LSVRVDAPQTHIHGVVVRVHFDGAPDEGDVARLTDDERARMAKMGKHRLATWVAGRIALSEALTAAGAPRISLLPDDRGAPTVPAGWVASLSHKKHIAVAIAAPDAEAWKIGVDVEELDVDRSRIAKRILTPDELVRIDGLPDGERWPAVLAHFSVKEAIYKAVDPFVRRYVAFSEAELAVVPGLAGGVPARLLVREGEFEVEATFSRGPPPIATARVRRR